MVRKPRSPGAPKAVKPGSRATSAVHVALIRGINVGKAKRVAMADLRRVVEALGFGDVRTLLNSGNVIFRATSAARAAERIEEAMRSRLRVPARVVVLGAADLEMIVEQNPLIVAATNPSRLMIAVPIESGSAGLAGLRPLLKEDWSPDALALGTKAAYFWCPEGVLDSRLANAIFRTQGESLTVRNSSTIGKLHALTRE